MVSKRHILWTPNKIQDQYQKERQNTSKFTW